MRWATWVAGAACWLCCCGASAQGPSGNAVIEGRAAGSRIVVRTSNRVAGAVSSLTWNGVEFIDSADHGRELQSASNFDAGSEFTPETFNPTEAGSRHDGAGPTSTSRLLHLVVNGSELQTTTQMAFWLRPGEESHGHPAKNRTLLSNHLLTKRIRIGDRQLPHVISYDATFSVPVGEHHTRAQFEAVTAYMPETFSVFETWNPATGELSPLSDGPGEQPLPVVFSNEQRTHAMAMYAPAHADATGPGYGRWHFDEADVVKMNCVWRLNAARGVPAGEYSFRTFLVVGDTDTVTASLRALHAMLMAEQASHGS